MLYIFLVLLGVLLGYFLTQLVLSLLTGVGILAIFWAASILFSPDHSGSLADVIPLFVLIATVIIIVVMWLTHYLRVSRPSVGWVKVLKKKTLK